MKRSASIVASFALCAGIMAGSVATAPSASASVTNSEYKTWTYLNNSRTYYGRRPLALSTSLSTIAHWHSEKMAASGTIFHTSNLTYTLRNYSWTVCGENVGMGPSLWDIHLAFMRSAPHRANILYGSFTRVGVGVVWSNGMAYITEIFASS